MDRPPSWRIYLARLLLAIAVAGMLAVLAAGVPAAWVYFANQSRIYNDPASVPSAPVAIVFGAGLQPGGGPSWMLADRIDAAVELYKAGKVRRVLMTGDNSTPGYNEVAAMRERAVAKGVPPDRVNLDYAGFRTYDSCYRAKAIFGIDRAILVTQRYHLPRALFLARSFGIDAVGLAAGIDSYPNQGYYDLRELAALALSWYEVNIIHPLPRYLGDPIDLERQNLQ